MVKHNIDRKIIWQGILTAQSAILVGSGTDDDFDKEVMKDEKGIPYLPGSSIAGAIKSHLFRRMETIGWEKVCEFFWGTEMTSEVKAEAENASQSHIAIDDATATTHVLSFRDSVKIDHKSGVAEQGKKYDFECVDVGASFSFNFEITIREEFKSESEKIEAILQYIESEFKAGRISIGAFSSRGFGKIKLTASAFYIFDFTDSTGAVDWLLFQATGVLPKTGALSEKYKVASLVINECIILTTFNLKDALIIGAHGNSKDDPDKSQLAMKDGTKIIPGKSLAGVILHRALMILNTVNPDAANEEKINTLFGFVDEKRRIARRSKVTIDEIYITRERIVEQLQPRIRINRFTSGAANTALFESQPIWHKDESIELHLTLEEPQKEEIALLLHVIKDLCNEDLPVGGEKNVGRGLLQGQEIRFEWEKGGFIRKTWPLNSGAIQLTREEALKFNNEFSLVTTG